MLRPISLFRERKHTLTCGIYGHFEFFILHIDLDATVSVLWDWCNKCELVYQCRPDSALSFARPRYVVAYWSFRLL